MQIDTSPVDEAALDELIAACTDRRIREELAGERHRPATCAAIMEDALHHDRWAWPRAYWDRTVRPPLTASAQVSMPLPREAYKSAVFADSILTAP